MSENNMGQEHLKHISMDLAAGDARVTRLSLDGNKLIITLEADLPDSQLHAAGQALSASQPPAPAVPPAPAAVAAPGPLGVAAPAPMPQSAGAPSLGAPLPAEPALGSVGLGSETLAPPAPSAPLAPPPIKPAEPTPMDFGREETPAAKPVSPAPPPLSLTPEPRPLSIEPMAPVPEAAPTPPAAPMPAFEGLSMAGFGSDLGTPPPAATAPQAPAREINLGGLEAAPWEALAPTPEPAPVTGGIGEITLGDDPVAPLPAFDGDMFSSPAMEPVQASPAAELRLGDTPADISPEWGGAAAVEGAPPPPAMETWDPSSLRLDTPGAAAPDMTPLAMSEGSSALGGARHGEPQPAISFGMDAGPNLSFETASAAPAPAFDLGFAAGTPPATPPPTAAAPAPLAAPDLNLGAFTAPPPAPAAASGAGAPPPQAAAPDFGLAAAQPAPTPAPAPQPPPAAPAPTPPAPAAEPQLAPEAEKSDAGGTTVLIRYTCPKCKTQGMQAVDKVGTVVNCSNCGKAMRLVMKK